MSEISEIADAGDGGRAGFGTSWDSMGPSKRAEAVNEEEGPQCSNSLMDVRGQRRREVEMQMRLPIHLLVGVPGGPMPAMAHPL